jgi:hypothetical protein
MVRDRVKDRDRVRVRVRVRVRARVMVRVKVCCDGIRGKQVRSDHPRGFCWKIRLLD